ncbi:hypothetical protein AAG906_011064 [Vitis piasezkii]
MEGKQNISQYRERMDKTLASHDLVNEEALKAIVKNQLLHSSEHDFKGDFDNVLEKRTKQVSNFLEMLRSTSKIDKEGSITSEPPNAGWKLKQDNKEYRVMYREGPQGTPFHSLLVEGYIDGAVDVCLCVSWEASLYKKWWPQFTIPTFKVVASKCLQKIRVGEQIALVRMKLSWPLSAREAVVHYFEVEYFQDGLIIVLLNSISDSENFDESTYGLTDDGTPELKDTVRIDVVGGFAVQQVTPDRSYFRTIANMDIKLDFVPPSLINFISRQLVGSGFRLYQKIVSSASEGNEDFHEALGGPLYTRIREALCSNAKPTEALGLEELKIDDACTHAEEYLVETVQADVKDINQRILRDDPAAESPSESSPVAEGKTFCEIQEEETEEGGHLKGDNKGVDPPPISPGVMKDCNGIDLAPKDQMAEKCPVNDKGVCVSPKVEEALGTLEEIISVIRGFGHDTQSNFLSIFANEGSNLEKDALKRTISSADGRVHSNGEVCVKPSENGTVERTSVEPRNSPGTQNSRYTRSNSQSREVNHNRIAPASPEQNLLSPCETQQVALHLSRNEVMERPMLKTSDNSEANVSVDEEQKLNRQKRRGFCCFNFISG